MPAQKNITLQVHHTAEKTQSDIATLSPTKDCNINIQVADGWAITGHYHNHVLQTITLQKTTHEDEINHG